MNVDVNTIAEILGDTQPLRYEFSDQQHFNVAHRRWASIVREFTLLFEKDPEFDTDKFLKTAGHSA